MASQQPGLISLFNAETGDLTIKCRDKTWKVHKMIVCPQSPFFSGACNYGFTEAKSGTIDMSDDDPEMLEPMLRYLYRDIDPPDGWNEILSFHYKLAVMADKYLIPALRKDAIIRFEVMASSRPRTGEEFVQICMEVFHDDSINGVNKDIKRALLKTIKSNALEITSRMHERFRANLESYAEIGAALIRGLVEGPVNLSTLALAKCSNCSQDCEPFGITNGPELDRHTYCVRCGCKGKIKTIFDQEEYRVFQGL